MFSSASTTSWSPDGTGWGTQSECSGCGASALRSISTASRSVPETPSTSAWCVLASMAQRPSSSPSTTQISHRGFVRSSGWDITRPTSLRSSLSPPGDGERGVTEVVLNVEVRVVHPDRAPQLERDEAHLLAEARDEVESGVDHRHNVAVGRRRPFEDRHRGDVHVGHVVLNVEERRVQRAQSIRAHRPSLRGSSASGGYYRGWRDFRVSRRWPRRRGPRAWPAEECRRSARRSPRRRPRSHGCCGPPPWPGAPWRDASSGPGSRLTTAVPAPWSREISRSSRRCTERRRRPSAPLAAPLAADMDETMTTRSRPSPRTTSALVAECTPPSTYSVSSMVTGRK